MLCVRIVVGLPNMGSLMVVSERDISERDISIDNHRGLTKVLRI